MKKAQQSTPTIKVGSTQIKPIINASTVSSIPQPVILSQSPVITVDPKDSVRIIGKDTSKEVINSVSTGSTTTAGHAASTLAQPPKMVAIKSQSTAASNKLNAGGTVYCDYILVSNVPHILTNAFLVMLF